MAKKIKTVDKKALAAAAKASYKRLMYREMAKIDALANEFYAKLYKNRHIMVKISVAPDKEPVFSWTTASNSPMNRAYAEAGKVQKNKPSFVFDEDGNKIYVRNDDYVHTDAAIIEFSGYQNTPAFLSEASMTNFVIDIKNKKVDITNKESIDTFTMGISSPSAEKKYTMTVYKDSKEEIFRKIDDLSGNGFSIASDNNIEIKHPEARIPLVAGANSLQSSNIVPWLKANGYCIAVSNMPLEGLGEIINKKEVLDVLGKVSNETSDGLFFMVDKLAAKVFSDILDREVQLHEVKRVAFQGRSIFNMIKALFACIGKNAIKQLIKYMLKKGADIKYIGDPNGECIGFADSNCEKVHNNASICTNFKISVLDVAKVGKKARVNSQLANLFSEGFFEEFTDLCKDFVRESVAETVLKYNEAATCIDKNSNLNAILSACGVDAKGSIRADELMNEIISKSSGYANKGNVETDGFFARLATDTFHSYCDDKIKGLLNIKNGYMEVYAPYATIMGYKRAIFEKCPSQGIDEYVRVKFVSEKELLRRVRKIKNLTTEERVSLNEAIKSVSVGVAMTPASDLIKEVCGGHDFDFDGASFFTDERLLDLADQKTKGMVFHGCFIRYEVKSVVEIANNKKNVKKYEALLGYGNKKNVKKFDWEKAFRSIRWGSNVGPVIAAGDMVSTLDENALFKKDGKMSKQGIKLFKEVFKIAGDKVVYPVKAGDKGKNVGHRYESIFKDGFNRVDAKIELRGNIETGRCYLVNKTTVALFKKELESIDLFAMTKEDLKLMKFEFSFCVRALGESSIDVTKKGSEVDLGVDMFKLINGKMKRLSANINLKEGNGRDFRKFCVYKKMSKEDAEKVALGEKVEGITFDIGLDKKLFDNVMKGNKTGYVPDKFGKLKLILLKTLEEEIQDLGATFYNNGVSEINWYDAAERTFNTAVYIIQKERDYSFDQSLVVMKELIATIMETFTAIEDDFWKTSDFSEIRNAIWKLFNEVFRDINRGSVIKIVAYALMQNYYLSSTKKDKNNKSIKKTVADTFKASSLMYDFKLSPEKDRKACLDYVLKQIHKVFGLDVALLFKDKVRLDIKTSSTDFVFRKGDKSKVESSLVKKLNGNMVEFYIDGEEDRGAVFLMHTEMYKDYSFKIDGRKAYLVGSSSIPKGDGTLVVLDRITKAKPVVKKHTDNEGNETLKKVVEGNFSSLVKRNSLTKEFVATTEEVSTNYDFVGLNVNMPDFNKKPDKNKVGGGRTRLHLDAASDFVLGSPLFIEKEIKGVITFASKNVLIIK